MKRDVVQISMHMVLESINILSLLFERPLDQSVCIQPLLLKPSKSFIWGWEKQECGGVVRLTHGHLMPIDPCLYLCLRLKVLLYLFPYPPSSVILRVVPTWRSRLQHLSPHLLRAEKHWSVEMYLADTVKSVLFLWHKEAESDSQ